LAITKERRRMFPSEMVILMAIEATRDSSKKLPSTVGTGEYISRLYDSLVRRGYLKKNSLRGYQLTLEGRESLFEFLLENKARLKEMVKALQQLGVEASEEIDKLAREVLEVK